jgi:hypothetical protein
MGFLLRHLHTLLVGFSMYTYQKRRGTGLKLSSSIMGQRKDGNICRILGLEATDAIFRGAGILSIGGRGTIKGWRNGGDDFHATQYINLHSCNIISFLALLERCGLVPMFVGWVGIGYLAGQPGSTLFLMVLKVRRGCLVMASKDQDMHLHIPGNPKAENILLHRYRSNTPVFITQRDSVYFSSFILPSSRRRPLPGTL